MNFFTNSAFYQLSHFLDKKPGNPTSGTSSFLGLSFFTLIVSTIILTVQIMFFV